MSDDWASDSGDDLGDLSALPEVQMPDPPAAKPAAPITAPPPVTNAWTSPNQSGDVRAAAGARGPSMAGRALSSPTRPSPSMLRTPARRENFGSAFSGSSTPDRTPRQNGAAPSPSARAVTLYVSNLPFETNEGEIGAFFSNAGVEPADIRLTRHSDTGNIKAAFVTLTPEASTQHALSLDGRQLGSRSLHIKIEGSDRDRRSGSRDYGHGRERDRDRSGHGSVSYGGAFGSRDRRSGDDSSSGWGAGGWVDRSSSGSNSFDATPDRRDRGSDNRDGRLPPGGRGDSQQAMDPTIPTGPPAPGRKKLQLKPRTKPPPVLDVDRRTIDMPKAPQSAPPILHRGNSDRPTFRKSSTPKTQPEAVEDSWTRAKESGISRPPTSAPSPGKKDEESTKRPVLLNTFSALEVNDSEP